MAVVAFSILELNIYVNFEGRRVCIAHHFHSYFRVDWTRQDLPETKKHIFEFIAC